MQLPASPVMKLRIIIGSLPLPPLLLLLLLLATLALSSAPTLAAPAASAKASEADRLHAQQQEKRDLSILRGLIPVTRFPGTNLLAASYPNEITVRYNGTVVIIPTSKSVAQSLLPANEKLLPTHPVPGLAADQWPIVLQFGLSQDIKQYNSGVGDFYTSRICVPWTDRSADGKTPFSFHVVNVLNLTPLGLPGAFFSGEQVKAGLYNPSNQALGIRAGSAGTIGSTVVQASILKEPLFDFKLTPISQQDDGLGLSVFSDFAQQGYTNSKSDTCTYHATTYDLPLTNPTFVRASLTLSPALGLPKELTGTFHHLKGLRTAEHFIETLNRPCQGTATFPPKEA